MSVVAERRRLDHVDRVVDRTVDVETGDGTPEAEAGDGAFERAFEASPLTRMMSSIFGLLATCVAVCWGIPQTLGMGLLAKKEEKGREKCAEWGIDVSDVEQGNWGRIRERVKQEAIRRGEEMPKF